jgi:hypothetical protein
MGSELQIIGWDRNRPYLGWDVSAMADWLPGNTDLTVDEIDDVVEHVERKGCVNIPLAQHYDAQSISSLKAGLEGIGAIVAINN